MDVPDGLGGSVCGEEAHEGGQGPALSGRLLELLQYDVNETLSWLMTCLILLRSGCLMISY